MSKNGALDELIYKRPGFLARQFHRVTAALFLDETASFGLTGLQFGVLLVVATYPGTDQIGVCNILGVDRSTLAGVVDRLEEKGLVSRRTRAADRRANALRLTRAGSRILGEIGDSTVAAEARALEVLSPEERAQFLDMLSRIVEHHARYAGMPTSAASPGDKGKRRRRSRPAAPPAA